MPVNLIDIQNKLHDFSSQARARNEVVAVRHQEAVNLVEAYADRLDELKDKAGRAIERIPRLRCALPVDEPLNTAIPCPELPKTFTVLAADGSQINPSRHSRVTFCVINVAVVKLVRGSGQAPEISTHSQLLDYDSVFLPAGGMITEGIVALRRDLREREALVDLADNLVHPAVSMTDGPLELYREPQEAQAFNRTLDRYLEVLNQLRDRGLMTLGYIDKPGSDLITRLLELALLSEDEFAGFQQRRRRFAGVNDVHLLLPMLKNPGERSALFAIHSEIAQRFQGPLGLHFFYLNVGKPERPHLARVEIPGWVAGNSSLLATLQAVLVEQAAILGTRPYPYILHRAHEEAVVSLPESQHVEDLIVAAFDQRGIPVDEQSYKQFHKDLPTKKTRYQG